MVAYRVNNNNKDDDYVQSILVRLWMSTKTTKFLSKKILFDAGGKHTQHTNKPNSMQNKEETKKTNTGKEEQKKKMGKNPRDILYDVYLLI